MPFRSVPAFFLIMREPGLLGRLKELAPHVVDFPSAFAVGIRFLHHRILLCSCIGN